MKTTPKALHKNLKSFTKLQRESFNEKQIRTITSYSNISKLKAVIRWRSRISSAGINIKLLAEAIEKPYQRISEWLNFHHEPLEENYLQIEKLIYDLEAK